VVDVEITLEKMLSIMLSLLLTLTFCAPILFQTLATFNSNQQTFTTQDLIDTTYEGIDAVNEDHGFLYSTTVYVPNNVTIEVNEQTIIFTYPQDSGYSITVRVCHEKLLLSPPTKGGWYHLSIKYLEQTQTISIEFAGT
jgi:hypothetical protein